MEVRLNKLHEVWLEDNRECSYVQIECDECGNDIFTNEDYYEFEGYKICEDCKDEFISHRYLVRGEC